MLQATRATVLARSSLPAPPSPCASSWKTRRGSGPLSQFLTAWPRWLVGQNSRTAACPQSGCRAKLSRATNNTVCFVCGNFGNAPSGAELHCNQSGRHKTHSGGLGSRQLRPGLRTAMMCGPLLLNQKACESVTNPQSTITLGPLGQPQTDQLACLNHLLATCCSLS